MIIDAHCHIGAIHNRYIILVKDGAGIIDLMDRFHINKACVSSLKGCQGDITDGNLELKKEIAPLKDRFIPFCVIHPRQRTAIREMRRCIEDWGWRAIKLHPYNHTYPADCYSARKIVREAAELDVPVLVHSSKHVYSDPQRVGKLAEMVPNATIIMGHMGGHLGEWDALEVAEEYENIILDTAASSMRFGLVAEAVDRVGAERVVFGTNMPICYPGPNIVRVTNADITEKQKRMVLGESIARIVGIKL